MSSNHPSNFNESLQTWLEDMPFGVYRTHIDGTILYANRAAVELFGYDSVDELMKRSAFDLYAEPHERQQVLHDMQEAPDNTMTTDRLMLRKDGTSIWVRNTMRMVRDESGNIRFFQGGLQDVSHEKKQQSQLLKQSQHLRSFSEAVGIVDDIAHLEETLNNALSYLQALIPYETASIFLFTDERITHVVGRGFESQQTLQAVCKQREIERAALAKCRRMKAEDRTWILLDPTTYEDWVPTRLDQDYHSHLGVSLLYHDEIIGLLNIDHPDAHFFTPETIELAGIVAQQLTLVIINARLFMRADRKSVV
jgi:PAS domain S-box-containing protein